LKRDKDADYKTAVQDGRNFCRKFRERECRHKTENNYRSYGNRRKENAVECKGRKIRVAPRYGIISEEKLLGQGEFAVKHVFLGCFKRIDNKPENRIKGKERKNNYYGVHY
jgi:hypothetical protein